MSEFGMNDFGDLKGYDTSNHEYVDRDRRTDSTSAALGCEGAPRPHKELNSVLHAVTDSGRSVGA